MTTTAPRALKISFAASVAVFNVAPAAADCGEHGRAIAALQRVLAGELLASDAEIIGGITQLRLADGDIISIVGDSRITSSHGEVTLQRGRFTVAAGPDGVANVRVAGNMLVTVNGQNASASFAVDPAGLLTGRSLGGTVSVTAGGVTRSYDLGEAFRAALDQAASPAPVGSRLGTLDGEPMADDDDASHAAAFTFGSGTTRSAKGVIAFAKAP